MPTMIAAEIPASVTAEITVGHRKSEARRSRPGCSDLLPVIGASWKSAKTQGDRMRTNLGLVHLAATIAGILGGSALSPSTALAQSNFRPGHGIAATIEDVKPHYLLEGHPPLDTDFLSRTSFQKSFMLDMAYNLKLWHFPQERGGLGRTVTCNGFEQQVVKLAVEGIHVHDGGARAIVYYSVDFAPVPPSQQTGTPACSGGSLMLPLQRFSDGEWFAPDWGYRLVRGR